MEKELEVPPFCDVHVDVPYNVRLKPVDIHKYHNCDKLLVQIDERCEESLQYDVDGNRVTIIDKFESKENDLLMKIKAPVKSSKYNNHIYVKIRGVLNSERIVSQKLFFMKNW